MRSALVALLCVLLAPGVAAAAKPPPSSSPAAPTLAPDKPRVLLVFLPGRNRGAQTKVILKRFEQRPQMALGVVSSTAGRYDAVQTLLDITQGTRTSFNVYKPKKVPDLALVRFKEGGAIAGWFDAVRRAEAAPEEIHPGLLASSVPGRAGYVGLGGKPNEPAISASDEGGLIPAMSLGRRDDLVERTQAMLDRKQFVVVGLPSRRPGGRALDALLAARKPNELIIAMREPPSNSAAVLLPIAAVGLGDGNLTSDTSRHDGIVAGIDILPTVLDHLGIKVPKSVKGQPMRAEGKRSADSILDFEKRSRVVSPRRLPTLEATLLGWLILILLLGVIRGPPGVRRAMRAGGLAALWLPFCLLIPALFTPDRTLEYLLVAGSALVLGLITDLVLRWPRGPMLPAVVTLVAYTVDLANGSPLIVRSLLGPNPRFGSRFYGLGNELEALLPIIVLDRARGDAVVAATVEAQRHDLRRRGPAAGPHRRLGTARRGRRRRDHRGLRVRRRDRAHAAREAHVEAAARRVPRAGGRALGARRPGPRHRGQLALHADSARRRVGRVPRHRQTPLRAGLQRAQTRPDPGHHRPRGARGDATGCGTGARCSARSPTGPPGAPRSRAPWPAAPPAR